MEVFAQADKTKKRYNNKEALENLKISTVYKSSWGLCPKANVGQSARSFKTRCSEQKRAFIP